MVTEERTPLSPEVVEEKYYASGVGMVLETTVRGGIGRIQLIEYHHPAGCGGSTPTWTGVP